MSIEPSTCNENYIYKALEEIRMLTNAVIIFWISFRNSSVALSMPKTYLQLEM